MSIRIGIGFDVHRFDVSRPLMLGGVHIPDAPGLAGHSDADVLCHAVADAMLGAAALGDIGRFFPDSDERWRGITGVDLLKQVRSIVAGSGWKVGNVDCQVLLEAPWLAPHVASMRDNVSAALEIGAGAVGIKATTTEGLGTVGRREGAACMAVVLLEVVRAGP